MSASKSTIGGLLIARYLSKTGDSNGLFLLSSNSWNSDTPVKLADLCKESACPLPGVTSGFSPSCALSERAAEANES